MKIVLYGFMGVGKTTVGKMVANELGLGFIDMDQMIERRAGKRVAQIFAADGEDAFREMERQAAQSVAHKCGIVVACGGGALLDQCNVEALVMDSTLVLLTASIEDIMTRTLGDSTRPLLGGEDRQGEAEKLLLERMPKYLDAADLVVDTSGATPNEVAGLIIAALGDAV
ncbi:shikimate kinase [Candidatus Bathyarchaeota archaeon]|nr:shikimate kinase [Candidatus Bathyarchaeota archaeon]